MRMSKSKIMKMRKVIRERKLRKKESEGEAVDEGRESLTVEDGQSPVFFHSR